MPSPTKKADQYNDSSHNYLKYWDGRSYENKAEEMAIKRLLRCNHFKHAVDVGGGFGRLCILLERYSDRVTLAEPSAQQLEIAEGFLNSHPKIERTLQQADALQFPDQSVDLVTMVRVMHHLPDPSAELAEIHRVLTADGLCILEVANLGHAVNRLRYLLKGRPLPTEPVDIRSATNQDSDSIAFVNHNPHTMKRQLDQAGFKIVSILSVSNFRSTALKKILPEHALIWLECLTQPVLAPIYFGPSIFFLLKKK